MDFLLEKIDFRRVLKYLLFLLITMGAQNMIFSHLRLAGVCPMILPAVAVAVGMFEKPVYSTLFCILLGIFADMSYVENNVFFTISLPAVAFAAAFVSQFFINRRFFAFMTLSLVASFVTALLQMLLTFAGDAWSGYMLNTLFIQTLWSLPFSAAAYFPPARWIK